MLQKVITAGSIFLMLSGHLSAMEIPSLKEIVINRIAELITYDPNSCVTTFTSLPHDLSSTIIQHLRITNTRKSALPILLLGLKHYQQHIGIGNKQNQLRLLLTNNQQVQLTSEQDKMLIQASASIRNLIQDTQDIQQNESQLEEIPLPLLTQKQVIALLPYISITNALNASNSTLPMLQQKMPEIVGLSSYWIKYTAPQQIKEYLVACTIPTLCDLIITASYLNIQSDEQVISFIELATQALGDKLLQSPQYQDEYTVISTLPNTIQRLLVHYMIRNSTLLNILCSNGTDVIINTAQTLTSNANNAVLVARSLDGKYIASNFNNTIKIYDALTDTCIHSVQGHTDNVISIAWSPDGKHIASSSNDKTIKIWDASTGTCIQTFADSRGVNIVSWSSDGSMIASGSYDHTINIWNACTGTCIYTLTGHTGLVTSVSWSPDSSTIVTGSVDGTVKIWDITTGICAHTLTGHTDSVTSVSWSPNGKYIASSSHDKTVKLWDSTNGTCIHSLIGHIHWVESVSWSPDGSMIASGAWDTIIRVWDTQSGTCIHTLTGHTRPIYSVSWSLDGSQLVSGSHDNTIRIWNIINNEFSNNLKDTLSWQQVLLLIG